MRVLFNFMAKKKRPKIKQPPFCKFIEDFCQIKNIFYGQTINPHFDLLGILSLQK